MMVKAGCQVYAIALMLPPGYLRLGPVNATIILPNYPVKQARPGKGRR